MKKSACVIIFGLFAIGVNPSFGQINTDEKNETNTVDPSQDSKSESPQTDDGDGLFSEEIMITGSARQTTKLDSTYAVSSLSESFIETAAPLNTVDLLSNIPGFWAESSGGEAGNNVFARGIPQAGSLRYVALQEDGLTIFEETETAFANIDMLTRFDAMVERVEVVRGGTSPIYASNAPGGTINIITKKGSETPEGLLKLTTSDFGTLRLDAHAAGPIGENLKFSIGGFFRGDNGIRDPGFRANQGGQIRANLTYELEQGEVTAYTKYIDDSTVFYLPIPLQNPEDPSQSLSDLINPNTGTLLSNDLRVVQMRMLNGTASGTTRDVDVAEGMHPQVLTLGLIGNFELGDGWFVNNHLRYIQGETTFNALFSLTAPNNAENFLASQLPRAQAGFDAVDRLVYRYANGGQNFDPSSTAGLIIQSGWWTTNVQLRNFINDTRITKAADWGRLGSNEFTVGLYLSDYQIVSMWQFNTVLSEMRNNPRLLDIVALNAAGEEVGTVTENGFLSYGDFGVNAAVDAFSIAGYASDNWRISDSLTFDVGFRYQVTNFRSSAANRTSQNLGDPTTLADDNVGGPDGTRTTRDDTFSGWALSVGVDYAILPEIHAFGRFTRAYRIPDLENSYQDLGQDTERILQGEIGLKLAYRRLSAFLVGFLSDFDSLSFTNQVIDPETGDTVNLNVDGQTQTIGTELEIILNPFRGLQLGFTGTLQRPAMQNITDQTTNQQFDEFDGNRMPRIPSILLAFRPSYGLQLTSELHLLGYGSLQYNGDRYVDFANRTELPDYATINAGILATIYGNFGVQLHGSNLTNSDGLTEGNPRQGSIEGQGTSTAIFGRPVLGRAFQASLSYRF